MSFGSAPSSSVLVDDSSPPSPSGTPPFPPILSRRSTGSGESTSSLSGTGSPRFEIHDDDPLFSGLSLLDFLNVLDAHLEVWTRPLRRKSVTWREKADRLLDEAKQKGRETFKVPPLPSVPAFDLGEGLAGFRADRELREGAERKVLSPKDRERLERKYREVRTRMRDSVQKLVVKWEEECVHFRLWPRGGVGVDREGSPPADLDCAAQENRPPARQGAHAPVPSTHR